MKAQEKKATTKIHTTPSILQHLETDGQTKNNIHMPVIGSSRSSNNRGEAPKVVISTPAVPATAGIMRRQKWHEMMDPILLSQIELSSDRMWQLSQLVPESLFSNHESALDDSRPVDDGSSSTLVFPLEVYDDREWETKAEAREWITGTGSLPSAVALPMSDSAPNQEPSSRFGRWNRCTVTAYDAQADAFIVSWAAGSRVGSPVVSRLYLCFAAEDPFHFAGRIHDALARREAAMHLIKYHLSIACMPTDKSPPMDNIISVESILSQVLASLRCPTSKRSSLSTKALVEEVKDEFTKSMNQIILDACSPDIARDFPGVKFSFVEQLEHLSRAKRPLLPRLVHFSTQFQTYVQHSLFDREEVVKALLEVRHGCLEVQDRAIFCTTTQSSTPSHSFSTTRGSKKAAESLSLDDFCHLQSQENHATMKYLREKWIQYLVRVVRQIFNDASAEKEDFPFNFRESKRERYEQSMTFRLLKRINLIMTDSLRDLIHQSLHSYVKFIEDAVPRAVHVHSANRIQVDYDVTEVSQDYPQAMMTPGIEDHLIEVTRIKRLPCLFQIELSITKEKGILNQKEIDQRQHDIAEWQENHEGDDEECPWTELAIQEGFQFQYATSPEEFKTQVLLQIDRNLERCGKLDLVERLLMDHLYWSEPEMIPSVDPKEESVNELRDRVSRAMDRSLEPLQKYLLEFNAYIPMLNLDSNEYLDAFLSHDENEGNSSGGDVDKEDEEDEGVERDPPQRPLDLEQIRSLIVKHREIEKQLVESIPSGSIHFGMFQVDVTSARSILVSKHRDIIQKLLVAQMTYCDETGKYLIEQFEKINKNFSNIPKDIEEIVELQEYLNSVPNLIQPLQDQMQHMFQDNAILEDFQFMVSGEHFRRKWEVMNWPTRIQTHSGRVQWAMEERKVKYAKQMESDQQRFERSLVTLQEEVERFTKYNNLIMIQDVARHGAKIQQKIEQAYKDAQMFNSREALFNSPMTEYEQLSDTKKYFEPYFTLWSTGSEWINCHKEWTEGRFIDLDAMAIEKKVDTLALSIQKANKFFASSNELVEGGCSAISKSLKEQIDQFKPFVPLLLSLCSPGMRSRHWEQMSQELGFQIEPDETFTIQTIVELKLLEYEETIAKVSDISAKEYQIEEALDNMAKQWEDVDLQLAAYRETGTSVLRGVDELQALLDEQVTMTQAMLFSSFKGPFESRITEWNDTLQMVSDVLEEWMAVQRNWLYLQPIFESPDINKQLPTEGKRFATVDKNWRQTMALTKSKPRCIEFCNNEKLLEKFQESNKLLDMVQKGLSDYLEVKRSCFARFYFLSNDELLSILSESKDVKLVQPHLKKCFEGIVKVYFEDDLKISSMISAEGEQVAMSTPVDPVGQSVEFWMLEVEKMMKISVRDVMFQSIQAYIQMDRTTWIQSWPGMCVLNASQLHWTREMEESMDARGAQGVEGMYARQLDQLADMVTLVRGDLEKMTRITMGALTVIDVHARDVTKKLIDQRVESKADFLWSSQLKYYWQHGEMVTQMVTSVRPYGYEYLGNSFRLVITPLTDKCYLTLMGALQMVLGGAPAGPAGTGKTETTKDLAKALAKQCVVFNCSDGLDFIAMGKFFKGLASCGAWACFDEFNRIDIEVLSVVGQQVMTLQQGIRRSDARIMFEGSDIKLDNQFGVFITMNPGYAGRSDLPDSLAALFRPVAMMVPDYALIGEIMFFAYGFSHAKSLGAKMVTTFKLCSEQLSSQSHYDYGMRAVKTVITAAGNLKRSDPDMDEEVLLLRALQDVNLPKFLAHDLPLFSGIISDLFPGKCRPDIDLGALVSVIKLETEKAKLQSVPFFLTKCIQLYETIVVRHGLMVVGAAGGGKSSNIRVLCNALSELKRRGEVGFAYEKVVKYQLNPKSITMGQLYGEFDANTHEWQDGILSTLYRKAAACTLPDRKWVIFDGPVDAIWIENMNTVLDDNKKLCLNSGEMLQMSEQMSMMFEVEDLSVASPATVSRVGMVYMEPVALGLDPLIQSWTESLPPDFHQYVPTFLCLFDQYLFPSIAFHRSKLIELVPTMDNNLLASLLRLLDCYLSPYVVSEEGQGAEATPHETFHQQIEPLFVFSLVWSVGAVTNDQGRNQFDAWLRNEMHSNGTTLVFPPAGLVYDYCYDSSSHTWTKWTQTVPEFTIPPNTPFAEIVIPTMDSIRNTYLLQLLTKHQKHVLMVGGTGTGKTVNISRYLQSLPSSMVSVGMTFSAQTSANQTQDLLDSKMEKRRKGVFGPPAGKSYIIYIDDFNMPKREVYFAQPPLELIRQWFDQQGWYDRKALSFRSIIDIQFIASMGPPGGGRNPITSRLVRHFNIIGYAELGDESKETIFATILSNFFTQGNFLPELQELTTKVTKGSIAVYNTICQELLPTPAKSHYTFNLRDLAKVFQGCLMCDSRKTTSVHAFIRLWIHECQRVFEDRMISRDDHRWFQNLLRQTVEQEFHIRDYSEVVSREPIIFGDYLIPEADNRVYEEVIDLESVLPIIDDYLCDYNSESKSPMPLVLFMDAVEHISRISRILRQPLGNALLLGVGGSGRQSLTKLATFMTAYACFQVEIVKGYGLSEWRDDVKRCLLRAGIEDEPVVFLFSDVQIVNETMLEDLNGILNSGDVPNLYAPEDMDAIVTTCRVECQKKGLPPTKSNIFSQYLVRVRRNLHLVVCMSPIGDAFRARLRMFPALVNCCTIDWFNEWPAEALNSVATAILNEGSLELENLQSLVEVIKSMHQSVEFESKRYFEVLRRHFYVTPTSYLELLSTFKTVLISKRQEVHTMKFRLQNGVDKIAQTKTLVASMQQELVELQPVLAQTQLEVEAMMVQITQDRAEADVTKAAVEKEEALASTKASATKAIADSAQRDLDEALPALDAAVQCLNRLKKNDIDEVKAMKSPPAGVKLTMEVVCILFGQKPVMRADPDKPGKKITDYWDPAQKIVLSNANKFMENLLSFDKDNIPEAVIAKVAPHIEDPNFTPAMIEKSSKACTAICMWARAMHTYHFVAKGVEPKKIALAEAQSELDATMAQLAIAQGQLKEVTDRLAELEASYNAAIAKKEELAAKVIQCQVQLSNAEKLIGGLGGEEIRWRATVAQLELDFVNLTGDVLVSAGTISYLGAFTAEFRDVLTQKWRHVLTFTEVAHTDECDITKTLSEPVKLQSWQIAGLPTDSVSTQNGIVMSRSRRWPLLIDPQGQANRFVKQLGKNKDLCENGMDVIKQSDKNFLRTLENGIRFGKWVLLENIGEDIDAALEPVLLQQKFKQSGQDVIKLGDNTIPYNDQFRFYLTTKLANPHYPPEVCVKVTLLNFTITMGGLEEQLLGVVVQNEMPELAEKKSELVVSNAESKKQLYDIESQILYLLSHSEGNILDDTALIETLADAKATSATVSERMLEAEETEKEIDAKSEGYRPVAYRAALLFFAIADLSIVDPMYQYSLTWFTNLFVRGILAAPAAPDLDQRLVNLNEYFTYSIYKNVCRSLFEKHKLLLSFLLTIQIMKGSERLDLDEWRFLLSGIATGGGGGGGASSSSEEEIEEKHSDTNSQDTKHSTPDLNANPNPEWLTSHMWNEIRSLSSLPAFTSLAQAVASDNRVFRHMFDSSCPHTYDAADLPASVQHWSSFQKLCFLRTIRPDKVMQGIECLVSLELGSEFIEPPPFDLGGAFEDSTPTSPLIFILSQGSDPAKDLLTFARERGMDNRLKSIALGQGQGQIASRMIEQGCKSGEWILLQNCHLSLSWMPELEHVVEELSSGSDNHIHDAFRLWLTSMPTTAFPTSVLQDSVKMTKEAPKGLRANLKSTYQRLSPEALDRTSSPRNFQQLLFGLAFYHALVCERKRFGALGWNIPYQFNETDLDISVAQLEMFLDTYEEVPYEVLRVMTSAINYGGRITDDKDMRTSDIILSTFFRPEILAPTEIDKPPYAFSKSGSYYSLCPEDTSSAYSAYVEYIQSLPMNPEPEVFGMHDNANITCAQSETYENFELVTRLQPRTSAAGGKSREDLIGDLALEIQRQIPSPFDLEAVVTKFPVSYDESMNTVLAQEVERFNRLIELITHSLDQLQKGLCGLVVLSSELDAIGTSLYDQKVPRAWEARAYPSLKPLGPWVTDLLARLEFMRDWITTGIPSLFWISGFFFPQGFMTGIIQNHARRHALPIDTLSFRYEMLDVAPDAAALAAPASGCYIHGLYIEGARWNAETQALDDPLPKELFASMPVIHLIPEQHREAPRGGIYRCPVYKILTRTGTLSTTGHSTNFVMWIEIPSHKTNIWRNSLVSETNAQILFCDQEYWIKAGVACFCSLRF